jgi:hypothetical protein
MSAEMSKLLKKIRHFKHLIKGLLKSPQQMTLVCCKDDRIAFLNEYITELKENISFTCIEKSMNITDRLGRIRDFNSSKAIIEIGNVNILIAHSGLIVGLDLKYVDELIIFDEPDVKDFPRLIGRMNKNQTELQGDIFDIKNKKGN